MTSKSRLERNAKALAEVIAERVLCNLTPTYHGFDAISGMYDFDRENQRKFNEAYDHYFTAASIRLSSLTTEQQKLHCENVEFSENYDTLRIID
ncbi:hypothetical protein OCA8868_00626 [Octadecabacter ascidiaceicola]|uniref:Uncharacterized protein n=1 Tax=Octadecabacter ascidiaceicola TaxID=1655543 RepID=A0A238JQS0_9RHOB|nr:hypothetical protein OCA8868_00626 [Octadecabacter ascidiaceicola]